MLQLLIFFQNKLKLLEYNFVSKSLSKYYEVLMPCKYSFFSQMVITQKLLNWEKLLALTFEKFYSLTLGKSSTSS